jgi:hypothetical protein
MQSLREVIFRKGRLREIGGFDDCPSLSRIETTQSQEKINGFNSLGWNSTRDKSEDLSNRLNQVVFSDDCELKKMKGFNGDELLEKMSIPCSVERLCRFNSMFLKDTADEDWDQWIDAHSCDRKFVLSGGVKEVTFRCVSKLKNLTDVKGFIELKIPGRLNYFPGSVKFAAGMEL